MTDDPHVLKPTKFHVKENPRTTTDEFGQQYTADNDKSKWSDRSPQESRRAHARSDADLGPRSLHHTLGTGHNQASPGDHYHDGLNSKKLGPLEMDPVNVGQTRAQWTLPDAFDLDDVVALLSNFVNFRALGSGLSNEKHGSLSVSFTSLSSTTIPVSFPTAYPTGIIPVVMTNINSSAGVTVRWGSRAYAVSETGFIVFLFKGDSADPAQTWSNISVQWEAKA